ncbi:MAG: histidine kinase [Bacteroidetes bacterium]|nr:histidine kinase [Bacteroidota bacterium]
MNNKQLKRFLFRRSFRVFLFYLIASVMIISIYNEAPFLSLVFRAVTFAIVPIIVFILNIEIIFYYKKRANQNWNFRNWQGQIFGTGFLLTVMLFILHYFIVRLFIQWGVVIQLPENMKGSIIKGIPIIVLSSLVQYSFIYIIQQAILLQKEQEMTEMEMLQLKNSNAETVNQLLQQQIKPHFLFNALTTLKSLIKKQPDTAQVYLVQLSEFLRASFASTGSNSGLASVKEELEICHNYMEMQKVRFGQALQYEVSEGVKNSSPNDRIPSFSLQPLLENAIKHNVSTNENPLLIQITREGNMITVSNNLQPKNSVLDSTGKGLSSLKERYRILSGDEVIVQDQGNRFSVSIKVLSA